MASIIPGSASGSGSAFGGAGRSLMASTNASSVGNSSGGSKPPAFIVKVKLSMSLAFTALTAWRAHPARSQMRRT
eukprot:5215079-Prymnesium_polylepis.1